jgi:cysteine synthase A
MDRKWVRHAIEALEADRMGAADTPLIRLVLPEYPGIHCYLKDETVHPTGSLKHRLAHSLFLHAICNGDVGPDTLVIEASSGSTAIAEAWFAHKLGLRFTAIVPACTAPAKVAAIEAMGGKVHLAPANRDLCRAASGLAERSDAHFMDQFTNAERVTDWRGNNNIAESIFAQMSSEVHPIPHWIVVGAGTGGTSATIGRYIRYRPELGAARLCLVDPESSIFWRILSGTDFVGVAPSLVEGIGRTHRVASFVPALIDKSISVPDAASIAAMRWLASRTGRSFGPSTGSNLLGILALAGAMKAAGQEGSIVSLACDPGDRYAATVYDDTWLAERGIDLGPWAERFRRFDESGAGPAATLRQTRP